MPIEFIDPFQTWKQFQISAAPEPGGNACLVAIEDVAEITECGGAPSGRGPHRIAVIHYPITLPCTPLNNPAGNISNDWIQAYRFKHIASDVRYLPYNRWECGANKAYQSQGSDGCPVSPDGYLRVGGFPWEWFLGCRVDGGGGNWAVEWRIAFEVAQWPGWNVGDGFEVLLGTCRELVDRVDTFGDLLIAISSGPDQIWISPTCPIGPTFLNADWTVSWSSSLESSSWPGCVNIPFITAFGDVEADFTLAPVETDLTRTYMCELQPGVFYGIESVVGLGFTKWQVQGYLARGAPPNPFTEGDLALPLQR